MFCHKQTEWFGEVSGLQYPCLGSGDKPCIAPSPNYG